MSAYAASILLLVTSAGCPVRPRAARPTTVWGAPFRAPGRGLPFSRFVANRDFMHRYLYNGDDLFPKAVNLCSRGRNALLDLDRGPGASFSLGLFGPAWEAHLYAVAVDRDPRRPTHTRGRTRFVYSWHVVSTAQTEMLRLAYAIAREAARRDLPHSQFWRRQGPSLKRLRWPAFLTLRRPDLAPHGRRPTAAPPARHAALRRAAGEWGQRLVIALLERLTYSVRVLGRRAGAGALLGDGPFRALRRALYVQSPGAAATLARFNQQLVAAARGAGVLFDARRHRAFHERALLASLGPRWRHGRVTADQLRAILAHLAQVRRRFDTTFGPGAFTRARTQRSPPAGPRGRRLRWRQGARLARLEPRVLRELARLDYILHGTKHAALAAARAHHGAPRVEADRQAYVRLAAEVKTLRKRLTTLARESVTPAVRRRLRAALKTPSASLAVGSFYFETEHLLETTSGFTHVGLLKRLPDPKTRADYLWVFDRVLGFHYAYPMSKLTNSVPVQALALSSRVAPRRRRYRWLSMEVPRAFDLGQGRISERVTLVNLFTHVRQKLGACPALTTTPGFFYAGISWLINHPHNKRILRDLWHPRVHTGYSYRSLDPERLQRLRGRVLRIPVLQVPHGRWTAGCPRRVPTSTRARKPGRL